MPIKILLLFITVQLAIFLLGYSTGRRIGKEEGFDMGQNYAPIELRQQLLENSRCPICNQKLNENTSCDKILGES